MATQKLHKIPRLGKIFPLYNFHYRFNQRQQICNAFWTLRHKTKNEIMDEQTLFFIFVSALIQMILHQSMPGDLKNSAPQKNLKNCLTLAKKTKGGVDAIEGVEGVLFRVPEILSAEVLEQMRAPPKDESIPIITAAELTAADGIVFGFPTRYRAIKQSMWKLK